MAAFFGSVWKITLVDVLAEGVVQLLTRVLAGHFQSDSEPWLRQPTWSPASARRGLDMQNIPSLHQAVQYVVSMAGAFCPNQNIRGNLTCYSRALRCNSSDSVLFSMTLLNLEILDLGYGHRGLLIISNDRHTLKWNRTCCIVFCHIEIPMASW